MKSDHKQTSRFGGNQNSGTPLVATAAPNLPEMGKAQLVWTLIVATMVAAATLHHLGTRAPLRGPSAEPVSVEVNGQISGSSRSMP